jgi:hypothetical protein
MTKKDLQFGMVVELGSGTLCLIVPQDNGCGCCVNYHKDVRFYDLEDASWVISLCDFKDDLTEFDGEYDGYYDIVKVYKDYTLKELLWERKEVLDEIEKVYLRSVIKPFRDRVKGIAKRQDGRKAFISIHVKAFDSDETDNIFLPYFKSDTMYKGMERGRTYTLEELGI